MRSHLLLVLCLTPIWALGKNPIQTSSGAIEGNADTAMVRSISTSYVVGNLAVSSPTFYRPDRTDGLYYYQAFLVRAYTSGSYSFISNSSLDTFGYLYIASFDPVNPNVNLIGSNDDGGGQSQFRIDVNLQYQVTYILIVTTFSPNVRGSFGVRATGPNALDLSPFTPGFIGTSTLPTSTPSGVYTGTLSSSSASFYRNPKTDGLYFYQALQVTVYAAGRYTFTSSSDFDTYGYLYNYPMDPSIPANNLIAEDDDGAGNRQFRIIYNVVYPTTFVLIVTSYGVGERGRFTIQAQGPYTPSLSAFVPVTSRPIQTTTITTTVSPTSYYGILSSSSLAFYRPGQSDGLYYYEALQITVYTSGTYTFTTSSTMDTFGLLYYSPIDPSYPSQNLITSDDDTGGNRQFKITANLQSSRTYVLIVTTYAPNVRDSYTLRMAGPGSLYYSLLRPSTSRPIRTTTSYSYSSGTKISTVGIIGIVFGCLFVIVLIVSVCAHANKQRTPTTRRVNTVYASSRAAGGHMGRPNGAGNPYTIPMQSVYVHSVEEPPPTYDQAAAYLKATQP